MTDKDKEKELYLKYCKYDEEAKEVILELVDLIEKQDKIIDLMAEQLTTPIHSKKWIKRYYEEEVEGEEC